MKDLCPGIAQACVHEIRVSAHIGGIIFKRRARGVIQRERINMLQKERIYAERFHQSVQRMPCVKFAIRALVSFCKKNMVADILYKRRAAFEVVGQSLLCCESVSHAPGV